MSERHLELEIWRDPDTVSITRRYIESLCETVLLDPDGSARVALVVHELLENAVKYASQGAARLRMDFEPREGSTFVTVCMSNRIEPAQVEPLRKLVEGLRQNADPYVYYIGLMRRNAKLESSGLGLARILAEGEMTLRMEHANQTVNLWAEAAIADGGWR